MIDKKRIEQLRRDYKNAEETPMLCDADMDVKIKLDIYRVAFSLMRLTANDALELLDEVAK